MTAMRLGTFANCPRVKNIVKTLTFSNITGEGIKNATEIPLYLYQNHWPDIDDGDIEALLHHVKALERISVQCIPNIEISLETFWWLKQKLEKPDRLIGEPNVEDSEEDGQTLSKLVEVFSAFGTVKALVRFLTLYSLLPPQIATKQETASVLQLKGIALELLHRMCVEGEDVAVELAKNDDFIQCLFTFMQYQETCLTACKVFECLPLSREEALDLSTICNFSELVSGFQNIQLANFCKILAITLSDLDMYEHKSSLYAQTKQKKCQNIYVRDVNQDIVLGIPNILARLVQIACAKPYIPCFPYVVNESDRWIQWIDNQLNKENTNSQEVDNSPFMAGISQWSSNSCSLGPDSAIKISTELSFRLDAVCVLGLLLVGRHRREVQKKLAELCLIPQLSELFDHFVWRWNLGRDHARLPGHNSSCECSPEVALKIQVLRLIHSFCDHSEYKHVMLSWSEYSELRGLEESTDQPQPAANWLQRSLLCVGSRGLLTKIVEVMKRETSSSTFRFWLSRAIESYLRGSPSSADQDFLIRRGLLQHVVGNLVHCTVRQKEVLQSSFDLLGELIKFNMNAFHQMDKILNTEAKQKKLVSLMNGNLVDSNMFIRSLILSLEVFLSSETEGIRSYAMKQCYLLSHMRDLKQRAFYLRKLVSLITVQNLTQENVSCLNTALVILMYAHKHGETKQYLEQLTRDRSRDSCSLVLTSRPALLHNLRELLLFWQDHYLQKDKDWTVLEKSSRISFQEWRDIVALLTSEDDSNPLSLLFYMSSSSLARAY